MTGQSKPGSRRGSGAASRTASAAASRKPVKKSSGVIPSAKMKSFVNATKVETEILSPITRLLLAEGDGDEPRDMTSLHVSELSKEKFCPRSAYYRLAGFPLLVPEREIGRQLQAIFEEGHDAHAKYQRWIRRLGRLYGRWQCAGCLYSWMATSPSECPDCEATEPWRIRYREVPVVSEKYRIIGHGDGQLDGPDGDWVEVKTIGIGTVRMEAPRLLMQYTRKGVSLDALDDFLGWRAGAESVNDIPGSYLDTWIDLEGLWKNIRRPFSSHLRQGNLYCGLAGSPKCHFIYEYKPTQASKEFTITASEEVYGPLIEQAKDVVWALEKNKAPRCPHGGCSDCTAYEQEQRDGEENTPTTGNGAAGAVAGRQGGVGEGGAVPGTEAPRRVARTPRRPDRTGGLRPDGAVAEEHGLGRLLGKSTGAG